MAVFRHITMERQYKNLCNLRRFPNASPRSSRLCGSPHVTHLTLFAAALLVLALFLSAAQARTGATVPWTTYEAEAMIINGGTILGPPPRAVDKNVTVTNTVESESSGRQCVKLSATGQYAEFAAVSAANTMVVRYSVPDTADGTGADYTLSLYVNGTFVRKVPMTSRYSWLYGYYTFSNNPGDGNARDYYDEARLMNLSINLGDHVRLQKDSDDTASYFIIDLVDLENIGPALTQPPGSRSVLTNGAVGNGIHDDTIAISNCVAASGIIWFPPGNYLVTNDINVPAGTTIQGAGMWYTTFVGNPATYVNEHGRVRFNGAGSNLHFNDFAILGKLTFRNDSEANDAFSEIFGTNSTISRVWVEHTKTGAWLANASGMVISDCRFRNTIADGINLCVGMNKTIVTNCTTRNTGDDSFAIWPATYRTATYEAGYNLITHCTAQSPFFANCSGIYGGISNRVEDCLFQDAPDGCGILIAGTFPIGTNSFRGVTVAQRCDLIRCGGNDPGWRWRGALTLCPDSQTISGLNVNNLNIYNSLSYAVQILHNTLNNASMSDVNVSTYAVGVPPYHPEDPWPYYTNYCDGVFGVFADNSANGSITVSNLTINGTNIVAVQTNAYLTDCVDKSGGFTFNFQTPVGINNIGVLVQANPAGHSFLVDGVSYTNSHTFTWAQVSPHTLAATSPQNIGAGVQDVWTSWSDGGALSHTVSPLGSNTYTANFKTQYYLTTSATPGGSVTPGSGWVDSGSSVLLTATTLAGSTFTNWTGNGNGSYSGPNNPVSITMNGPITETAGFYSPPTPPVQSLTWVQQPTDVLQGAVMAPEIQVRAFGTNGQNVAGVFVALSLSSGSGNLSGTLNRSTDTNGIAHFNDLSLDLPGTKTLAAASGAAPITNSNPFTVTALQVNALTATNNAAWNTASTWNPNGIPGPSDIAIIPSGKTVTWSGTPAAIGTILINGTFSVSASGTLGDVWVNTNGNFNVTSSGANLVFGGSLTNFGQMPITSLGSATTYTYSGSGKFLAGNINNVVASITGSYNNVGTFVTGLKGTQNAFKGSGSFTNTGVLLLGSGHNTTPTVGTLDCSPAGNLFIWTNFNGTAALETAAYYDVLIGQQGSSAWNLSGATINHDLTLTMNAPISTWPASNTIGGKLTYSCISGSASTFPATFSVGAFAQTAGKLIIPAGGTLTVSGNGPSVWTQAGGTLTAGVGGAVKFTGTTPEIGGAALNNLLLDITATDATAAAPFFVTNNLTIATGASLDVTALPAGTYALSATESLFPSGTIKGSVTAVSGSKIYAGTDGTYATGIITGNLVLAAGSTVNLDINKSALATNDTLGVQGFLTLNNNTFNLKAPSAGATIDTANDYTLVTAATISGTPILHWLIAPADTNYTLAVTATAIKLHHGSSQLPVRPTLNYSVNGSVLSFSWDTTNFPGFTLQTQTALNGAWAPVTNGNVIPVTIQIDAHAAASFFRLSNP